VPQKVCVITLTGFHCTNNSKNTFSINLYFRLCLKKFEGVGVDFVIGGDGPKRIVIEETIERYGLQSQVQVQVFLFEILKRERLAKVRSG
jgi:hypothetical protein